MTVIANKDGYLIVDVGEGAQMTCPTADLEWRLRYGDRPALIAASAIESFAYLVMSCSRDEAWRRIKIMREAMKETRRDV